MLFIWHFKVGFYLQFSLIKFSSIKAQFRVKHRMLNDFSTSIFSELGSIASSVSLRYFKKYYGEAVEAYQTILEYQDDLEEDEIEVFRKQFRELNQLAVKADVASVGQEETKSGTSQAAGCDSLKNQIRAKLPIISLVICSTQSNISLLSLF